MASIACSPFLSMPRDRAQVTRTGSPFFPRPQLNLVGASPASRLQTKNGSWAPTARLRSRVLCSRQNEPAVITGDSWENLILNSEIPVLVEFYASWCGPCRMVHRVIDEIAIDYAGRLKCFVLNTDNDFRVAEEYDIKAVPVVLLFSNGEKRDAVIGTMPKDFYVASIDKVLRP